jgi:hypothetical protein
MGPEVGAIPVMLGGGVTVNRTPLLFTALTVTTTFPVVAPAGTVTLMMFPLQLEIAADTPLKVTVPCVVPKFEPLTDRFAPTGPCVRLRDEIVGALAEVTLNSAPLLAIPFAVTTTFPVVAPEGTGTTMLVALQLVGVAAVPLNVTVPADDPKLVPVIVTDVLTGPEVGFRLVMFGG